MDIEILHDFLRKIRNLCNDRIDETIIEFQLKWNISSIAKIIMKMLGNKIEENSITNSFNSNQDRVIFLLLDGFGYTQYLWHLSGIRERKSATYSMNLFEWLSQFEEFNDSRILASTLVTDTGSAISTIFSGELPSSSGIFASKMSNGSRLVNVKQPKIMIFGQLQKNIPIPFYLILLEFVFVFSMGLVGITIAVLHLFRNSYIPILREFQRPHQKEFS